jgi:hypothetical protein
MTDPSTPAASAVPPSGQTINIQTPAAPPSNGLAVASMVLGIIAIFTFWIPILGWVPVILGLVLGIVAFGKPYGRGMAVTGVVCSGLALLVKIIFWIVVAGAIGAAGAASAAANAAH